MATQRITAELVEAMKPGDVVWDTETRGFGVRFRGSAIYIIKTRIRGKQTILTIGRHKDPMPASKTDDKVKLWGAQSARKEAIRLLGLIKAGKDPTAERREAKLAPTLAEFAARYVAEYTEPHKKPRTKIEDARLLKLHILPALGKSRLREITKAEVARFHSSKHAAPVAANRALALLSAILGWAEKVGERDDNSNPCRHIDRFPETARERFLTVEELARLGDALERVAVAWTEESKAAWGDECREQAHKAGMSGTQGDEWVKRRMPIRDSAEDWRVLAAVRLLLFSGARLSEILTLQWGWINFETGIARLPDSKTGRKNLILPAPALEILAALPRMEGNPHVLPGDKAAASFVGIQKPWQRIRAIAGLTDIHLHDLRHSFASSTVAAGDSLFIVAKLLGHRQSSTSERYSHLAPDPARAVADRTAERLNAQLRGTSGEVVTMRKPG